ncbi:MAG: ABC transporter permease [Micromonosporaceae bacterium]|nr:ABC transporter permease [Micromonosporaceae bacterium]
MNPGWRPHRASVPRAAYGKLLLNEFRLIRRTPAGLLVGVGVPLVLLAIFGSLPATTQAQPALGGVSFFAQYVPVLIAFNIATLGILSMPAPLASYRELGILRRLSTTPVPPSWVLGAQLTINTCLAIATTTTILVAASTAFGVGAPNSPAGFAVAVLLCMAAMFAIGLYIAALARTAPAANAIGAATFFPLMFFAGLWVPRQLMPPVLRGASDITPLGAGVQALQAAWQRAFPPIWTLLVLAGYAALFGWLAVRFFRWESSTGSQSRRDRSHPRDGQRPAELLAD